MNENIGSRNFLCFFIESIFKIDIEFTLLQITRHRVYFSKN